MKTAALASIVALALTGSALAQAPDGRPGRPQRDEVFKMVDAYVVSNLQESLGLSDQEFVKLLPLVKRLQTERRDTMQKRASAVQELRRTLRSGTATEAQVTGLLREVKAAELEEGASLRRNREAVDAALSPLQQAKFRVMEAEIDRKLRELMSEMRSRQERRLDKKPPFRPRED